jgi:hypothetical protein
MTSLGGYYEAAAVNPHCVSNSVAQRGLCGARMTPDMPLPRTLVICNVFSNFTHQQTRAGTG